MTFVHGDLGGTSKYMMYTPKSTTFRLPTIALHVAKVVHVIDMPSHLHI